MNLRNIEVDQFDHISDVEEAVEALEDQTVAVPTETFATQNSANSSQKEDEVRIIRSKNLTQEYQSRQKLLKELHAQLGYLRKHTCSYKPLQSVSVEPDNDFLTESLENVLWPSSKRGPERVSIEVEEEPCQGDEMEVGADSSLGTGFGEKRGTNVETDTAGGSDDPVRKKARPQDAENSNFLIDEFNMAMGDSLDSDDDSSV